MKKKAVTGTWKKRQRRVLGLTLAATMLVGSVAPAVTAYSAALESEASETAEEDTAAQTQEVAETETTVVESAEESTEESAEETAGESAAEAESSTVAESSIVAESTAAEESSTEAQPVTDDAELLQMLDTLEITVEGTMLYASGNYRQATIVNTSALNIRADASGSSASMGYLYSGSIVTVYGEKMNGGTTWYLISNGSVMGYCSGSYLQVVTTAYNTEAEFEAAIAAFPESYRDSLRALHAQYPNWKFVPQNTGLDWSTVVSKQSAFGTELAKQYGYSSREAWENANQGTCAMSLVAADESLASWKSMESEAFDASTATWVRNWDGSYWAVASRELVAYYLDPRNFLDNNGIFQFLDLHYDATQTAAVVADAANGVGSSWLSGEYTHENNTKINYPEAIALAGQAANMNPVALVCIMTQELGTSGAGKATISGTVNETDANGQPCNYTGYYNYYNIGAYVQGSFLTAYQRGLWYAMGANNSGTTYNRPWNDRQKAITGGAQYFADNYINASQNTLYLKRFDVMKGNYSFRHQFSTDIQGAAGEGRLMARAYTDNMRRNTNMTFYIPVYENMPSSRTVMPNGNEQPQPTGAVTVTYRTHVQTYGWQTPVSNGAVSGTSGESKRLEGIEITVNGNNNLGISYKTHVQTYGWQDWVSDGATSGTTGKSKRLEAICIELTGADKDKYDVYYRVHAQTFGWLGWARNGECAGSEGLSKRLEAIEIVVVPKGTGNYTSTTPAYVNGNAPGVTYRTHVQTYGWQKWMLNGVMAGTTGQSKRLEAINIQLTNQDVGGSIEYRTHVQTYGWQGWKSNGAMAGTSGLAKRLEAIQIRLTGDMASKYDIYYRTHVQTYGWSGWAKNGQSCGSEGLSKRLEGIEIRLVPKGQAAPGSTGNIFWK